MRRGDPAAAGVRALAALGVPARLDAEHVRADPRAPLDRAAATRRGCALPEPGGLGVRRTALSAALAARAREAGAEILQAEVHAHRRERDRIWALLDGAAISPRKVLVAADGLGSPVRRREGLDAAPRRARPATASGATSPCRPGPRRWRCTSARARRRT